jgi:membrane-bound metal-dependent hydrolase YbcI (DUF457 family)
MIAGHFGLAAGVKARAPAVPLWALMLATQWLDVLFVPLVLLGIEGFEPVPGARPGAYGEVIIHADFTHSLLGALLLSALFGAAAAFRYGRRTGAILALVAFSHWILDLLVHRGDMPILPGGVGHLPRLGFGLWRLPGVAAALELAIVVVGATMYWRAARKVAGTDPALGRRANVCGAGALVAGVLTLGLNVMGF